MAGQAELGGSTTHLVQVLLQLDRRSQKVEEWPTQLNIALDLLQLDREQKKLAKIQ